MPGSLHSVSQSPSVRHAISNAPRVRLEELLLQIWRDLEDSRPLINNAIHHAITGSENRERSAVDLCHNCHEDYVVDENHVGSCVYHECESNVPFADTESVRCPCYC